MKLTTLSLIGITSAHILGVSPKDQAKYQPDSQGNWACLGSPEVIISFAQVNDDICDCPDGSDEPGTAACPNGKFYCENKGFKPEYIPNWKVNDGVCDCCDGSDEKMLVDQGLTSECNFCEKVAKEYKAREEKLLKIRTDGLKIRKTLVANAKNAKESLIKEIVKAEAREKILKEEVEKLEVQLNEAKSNAEAAIPAEVFRAEEELGIAEHSYTLAINEIQRLQGEILAYQGLLLTMKTEYNPNFNDPAVKQAIRAFEEIQANSKEGDAEISLLDNLIESKSMFNQITETVKSIKFPVAESPDVWSIAKKQLGKFTGLINTVLTDAGLLMVIDEQAPAEIKDDHPVSGELQKKKSDLTQQSEKIVELKADLVNSNYGPDEVLRGLKNKCVTNHLGEYDYEFCFSGRSSQKGNGQNTNLGTFDKLTVNEDGTLKLDYENGAKCWSGPIRRTSVEIVCGEKDEILQVSEPERCEYFFKAKSPVACVEVSSEGDKSRDEL